MPEKNHDQVHLKNLDLPIYYSKPAHIVSLLNQKKLGILSDKGYAAENNHNIVITDLPDRLKKAKYLVNSIDKPESEILINAKIIDVDANYSRNIGVLFHTDNNHLKSPNGFNIDLPIITTQFGVFNFPLIRLGDHTVLNMELKALEDEGHAKMISSPELLTMNHHVASIEAGEEIPYQEATASGATSVTFKKAVLRLQVTPILLPHQNILLHLKVNQDKVSTLSVHEIPAIRTQQIETTVFVRKQQTIVLGGIFERYLSVHQQRIPIIGKIPVIGGLFRNTAKIKHEKELLIFITPTIISQR